MPRFVVLFGGPQGRMQQTFDAPSPEALRDHLSQQGIQPLGYQEVPGETRAPTAAPPPPAGFSLADAAQIAGGGLGTELGAAIGLGSAAPLLAVPIALGARVLAGQRGRAPGTSRSVAGMQEVLRGGPSELAALILPRLLGTIAQGVGAVRGTRSLPALKRLSEVVGPEQAGRVLSPAAEAEAARVTQGTAQTIRRVVGPIFRRETGGAPAIHANLTASLKKLATGDQERALLEIHDATGLRLDKLTTANVQTAIRTRPATVLQAAQLLGKHTGDAQIVETVRQQVARRLMSDAFRRALVTPPRTPFPGAFEGGKILDPALFGKGLARVRRALGPDGARLAFGADGLRELDRLSQSLGGARLAGELALATRGQVPQRGAGETIMRLVRMRPFGRAFALGVSHALGMGGFGETAAILTEESIAEMLGHLASTPVGLRWIAAGIDLQRRGFPDRLLIPALARSIPNVLAALGIGPQRENVSLAFGLGLGATLPSLLSGPSRRLAPPVGGVVR